MYDEIFTKLCIQFYLSSIFISKCYFFFNVYLKFLNNQDKF